jgi:hypothetical protein
MKPTTEHPEEKTSVNLILGVAAIFAIFAPVEIGGDQILVFFTSIAWNVFYSIQQNGFSFSLIGPAEWLNPFLIIRLVFVYQLKRYYDNKTSMRTTLVVGLLTEIPPTVITLINAIVYLPVIGIPTPLMLLTAYYYMRYHPRETQDEAWIERESKISWGPKITVDDNQ